MLDFNTRTMGKSGGSYDGVPGAAGRLSSAGVAGEPEDRQRRATDCCIELECGARDHAN